MTEIPDTPATGSPPQSAKPPHELERVYMGVVIAAIVVLGLYFGQPVLVPVALATLLSLALAPLVGLLRRLRIGRVPSVLIGVFVAVAVIGALGAFIGGQFAGLMNDLPRYQVNLGAKIRSIQGTAANNPAVQRASNAVQSLADQILSTTQSAGKGRPVAPYQREQKPIPVEIRQPNPEPIAILEAVAGPLLQPLGTLAIVIVFAGFFLLEKDDLRDRFIRLAGSSDLQRATLLVSEGGERLSQYLALQAMVNAGFGIFIAAGLWLIGVPLPGLWGLIAAILRFIPYIGVPIAAILPVTLGLATDPGWSMVLWTLALYFTAEPVTGQIVEPLVFGRRMGLSPAAIVIAATFWTWIWGPVGLLLSMPLTLCVVVIGRHIPQLEFLNIMLSDAPALSEDESFYLRTLAGDPDEAANRAEAFLKEKPLAVYYDQVVMKALALAQRDLNRGALDRESSERIRETILGLIENLDNPEPENGKEGDGAPLDPASLPPAWRGTPVLCVAGRGPLDEAAGAILVHLLAQAGIGARAISADDASPANASRIDPAGIQAICASYLEPGNFKSARYLVRRLRRRIPDAVAIAGYWCLPSDASRYLDSIEATECDFVVTSLREAVVAIMALATKGDAAAKIAAQQQPAVQQTAAAAAQ